MSMEHKSSDTPLIKLPERKHVFILRLIGAAVPIEGSNKIQTYKILGTSIPHGIKLTFRIKPMPLYPILKKIFWQ